VRSECLGQTCQENLETETSLKHRPSNMKILPEELSLKMEQVSEELSRMGAEVSVDATAPSVEEEPPTEPSVEEKPPTVLSVEERPLTVSLVEDKQPLTVPPVEDKPALCVFSSPAKSSAPNTPERRSSSVNSPISPPGFLTYDRENIHDVLLTFVWKDNDHTKRSFHKIKKPYEREPLHLASSILCPPETITQHKIFKSDHATHFTLRNWFKRIVCQECGETSEDRRGSKYTRIIASPPFQTTKSAQCKKCQQMTEHCESVFFKTDRILLESRFAIEQLTLPCGRKYTLHRVLYIEDYRYKVAFREDVGYETMWHDQELQPVFPSLEHTVLSYYMIKQAPRPKGFRNEGNTCYINSTLQILKRCLSYVPDAPVIGMICNLQRVIDKQISEYEFVNFMENSLKRSLRQQSDAALFLLELLRMISSEHPDACRKFTLTNWHRHYWCEHGRRDFKALDNTTHTFVIDTAEPFENVQQGLDLTFKGTRKCSANVEDCEMQSQLNFCPPEFLIITLVNQYARDLICTVEKDIKVYFSSYHSPYVLIGVVFHMGSSHKSGHYISQIHCDQKWYTISDDHVTECDDDSLPWLSNLAPSICLYERVEVQI